MFLPAGYYMVSKTYNDNNIAIRAACPYVHRKDDFAAIMKEICELPQWLNCVHSLSSRETWDYV